MHAHCTTSWHTASSSETIGGAQDYLQLLPVTYSYAHSRERTAGSVCTEAGPPCSTWNYVRLHLPLQLPLQPSVSGAHRHGLVMPPPCHHAVAVIWP